MDHVCCIPYLTLHNRLRFTVLEMLPPGAATDSASSGKEDSTSIPTCVLLHGFPDNALSFRYQAPALAKAGCRVLVPSMRGYEPSSVSQTNDYYIYTLVVDVVQMLDEFGIERVHLVGHDCKYRCTRVVQ